MTIPTSGSPPTRGGATDHDPWWAVVLLSIFGFIGIYFASPQGIAALLLLALVILLCLRIAEAVCRILARFSQRR